MFTIKKYGRRAWAVYDHAGKLIVVTMYKKGAEEVVKLLKAVSGRRKTLRRANPAPTLYGVKVTCPDGRSGLYTGSGFDDDASVAAVFRSQKGAARLRSFLEKNIPSACKLTTPRIAPK